MLGIINLSREVIMICKYCGCKASKVVDSRMSDDYKSIRRRRECVNCGRRFTTYETVEEMPIYVIKKGGGRQEYDVSKIRAGIIKACEKRPVPIVKIDSAIQDIENKIRSGSGNEISSEKIGEMVLLALKDLDDVAYIRYASVYKEFKNVDTFMKEIGDMLKNKKND